MSDKQEFFKLVNEKTKVPRLTPIPQINYLKSERLEKNPLQRFRAQAIKVVKNRPPPVKASDKWKTNVQRISKSFYTQELIKLAKAISIQGLLPEWEANILKLVPQNSTKNHNEFIKSVMAEVKQEYLKEMQNFNVRNVVNSYKTDYDTKLLEDYLQLLESNEVNRESFAETRKYISKTYFLSHELIITISEIFSNLPKNFLDLKKYKEHEELHISELSDLINGDLKTCSLIVQNQCYNEIIRCMLQNNHLKDDKRLLKLLHCAENFMVQQILNSMMNSINTFIEDLKNVGSCAQQKLQLLCRTDYLEIEPSLDTIFDTYHEIIDNITKIAQDLVPLEHWLIVTEQKKYIKVKLPEWFLDKAHLSLQEVLENNFKPLQDHYKLICQRFNVLCSYSTRKKVIRLIAKKKSFEVYCSQVSKYNDHLSEVNSMIPNIYYNFGTLNQVPAINDLKKNTTEIINLLIKELINGHKELNHSICTEFENLESRALAIPNDTKALFELTDYVSYASKVLVKELEEKIQESIKMLGSLIQIALLSQEHIELNKTTINWLELIKPVFSQHNIFCEAKKGELEDELQRKINVLSMEIDSIFPELVIIDDMDDAKRVLENKEFLIAILNKIKQVDNQIEWINIEEKLFKFPETTFPKVDEIKEVMSSFCTLVHIICQWQKDNEVWMDGPFEYLDAEIIEEKTSHYLEKISEMYKMFKVKIKSDLTSNKPFKFSGIVDDPDPLQQPAPLKLCWQTLQDLNDFKKYVSLAVCMCNPALEKRHWDEMSTIAGINLLPNAGTTLRKIISLDLLKDFENYEVISIGANKELTLQQQLNSMIEEWNNINFSMCISEELESPVFAEIDKIETLLEEQFVKIMKMRASYFITPIESKVVNLYEKLCHIRDIIDHWNSVQKQCTFLYPCFSNEIVQTQLETEIDLYNSLKMILSSIEESLSTNPTFTYITKNVSLLQNLKQGKYALELIYAKVRDYFETLRMSFTRLFFLSDNEIVILLFEHTNLTQKNSYIQKCFPGISRLKIDKQSNIVSAFGCGGEQLLLKDPIPILSLSDSVTEWIELLKEELNIIIKDGVNKSVLTFDDKLSLQSISNYPAMVTFCIWQIFWTSQIHSCFMNFSLDVLKSCRSRLRKYKENAQQFLKLSLIRKDREIITSLIILFAHEEEITSMLIEKKIHEDNDFDWKAQIRYYYQDEQVEVIIINTCIKYTYEYYSNNQRILINTPLTERCYRSLMEAYYHNQFGAMSGLSSVGKTETLKNLARTLAVPFFIFSGEDRLDYNCLGNIFKGFVTFEAWICFKNFTRIKEEILSVIAQYVFRISQSRSMNLKSINIHGTQLAFNPGCYITFSSNPTLNNLSELPANLKIHFRTVCFMNPDSEKICQIELYAAGFTDAKNLALKLLEVYNLCNEQMIFRDKYNLELRNLKDVVLTASRLKLSYPDEEEQVLLFRSLIDLSISQFVGNDIIIFQNIIKQSFSDVILPPANYDNLLKAIEVVCTREHLSTHDALKLKIIQLYEMIHLKNAIILVGDSFSGKTKILHVLKECLLFMKNQDNQDTQGNSYKINCEIINPGALNIERLFGIFNEETGNWNDGVCSDIIRNFSENNDCNCKWLIFDGSMHSAWLEKLETTIDDEKTLYLTSNERIILTKDIQIFFETSTLQDVTPVIISRCGIVHFDSQSSGWRPYLLADIVNVDQFRGYQKLIYTLFNWCIDPCLEFMHNQCTVSLALTDMHLVMSTLDLFKMYICNAIEESADKKEKETKDHMMLWSQAALIMAINWTLTGTLDFESKQNFEDFLTSLWTNANEKYPRPAEIKQFEVALPAEGKLRDNIYIFKGTGSWKPYSEIVKTEKIKEDVLFREPFIPTIDSVKLHLLFSLHVKYHRPFILCGENSNGKTAIYQDYLTSLSRSKYITNHFNSNSLLTSDEAQNLFLLKLSKVKRDNYEPSKNRYYINLIDDLNALPRSHSNSTLELIRQQMDYQFWYDIKQNKKINVLNTTFLASITTGSVKLDDICPRFLKHFNIFTLYPPTKENIFRIFSNTLFIDLKKNSFSTDIMSSINGIVNATVEIYFAAIIELRSSPSKVLYKFSLRDVQRIMKGCGLIQRESVETKITFIRLWVHEAYRVLGDRIIKNEDKQWLFSKIRETVKTYFKDPFESVFDHLPKYENDQITKESFNDLVFGNFMDADITKRKYEEVSSSDTLKNKCLQYIKEYNECNRKKIDLVMTNHAMQHLVRICRILAIPGGNMLMVSSSGSGRKSLTRLAAYIQQQHLFEPMIDTHYNVLSWKKDIKSILMDCGTLKKNYTFLITDRQMRPEFIRDVNSLISFGEIPQLFSFDEQREIIKAVRLDAQNGNRNIEMNMSSVFNYFLSQCKERLHFILNISPARNSLRDYLRKYPSLVDNCTINWFDCFNEKALEQVALHHMKNVNLNDSIKCQIILASKHFYNNAKQVSTQYYEETGKAFYVSPLSYVRTMKIYVDTISKKQENTKETRKRYLSGLDKLQLAAREVAEMKNTLTKLRPQLEASARQTEITMKEIENENISVERATILVKRDEEIANKKAEIAGILKAECEAELAVAIPILEDALAALNTLKPTDITLVKAMKNPPDTVKLVMAAVCVMLNVSSERVIDPVTGRKSMDFWGPSKRVLGDMNFLQNLKDYDKDNIPPTIMLTIKKNYMSDKSFMPHIVAKASSAAEGLCKWVRAMVSYDEVAKVVAPKKEKLEAAQKECDETEAFLNAKRKTLADLNRKLAALKSTLEATLLKKLELEREVENCTAKLKKAEALIASLGGEKTRWMDSANKLGRSYDNLAGDVLLSAAMITYLSPVSLTYRDKIIFEWKEYLQSNNIPSSEEYEFINFLGEEIKINNWYLNGLSNNQFSLQNAIIMEHSNLWPLFIDPQTQANQWIKTMEKSNTLQVIKVTDTDYIEIICKHIELGNPVLLENVNEEINVALDPIISRDYYKIAETCYKDIGQDKIVYNTDFRLYLTTRHLNPRFSPDIFNKVIVTDFLLPSDALRDRLLDIVISRERPELQEKFEKILKENIHNETILKKQEDNILQTLSASGANILEDEGAIKILDSSKSLAVDMMRRQEATRATKEEIDAFRETYSQFTKYCADLYSTLNMLPNLNYMYRFSLTWFTQLYIKSIETSKLSVIHKKRIDYLKMSSIQNLHQSVHNALFEKHKLIYSFILCAKTLLDTEQVTEQEFNLFMSIGGKNFTKFESDIPPNPASSWISDKTWIEIFKISNMIPVFQSFANSFHTSSTRWRKYCSSIDNDDCIMPSPWDHKLSLFQKLIVIRILCPDKILFKITEFVESVMGSQNHSYIPCNISRPYAESTCFTPLVFILPSYSAPFAILNKFAKNLGYSSKLHSLSMGPAQEQKAELLIEMARKNGEWIFLHNCHLALPWMMKLEKVCENCDVSNTNLGFRLWLSTQTNNKFPIGILQNSIKIAFDYPYDVKQTLAWSYKSDPIKDKDFFEGCPGRDRVFTRLIYGFCLFHAVMRERKNFGFQSWNLDYDFDESDLQMSIKQLKSWISQCEKVPFKALNYFLSECNYGGKIMDVQDKIYLDTLVVDYCNNRVISDSTYDFETTHAYRVPKRIEYIDYLRHIRNNIPSITSPEEFGLDKNVALIKNSNKAKIFIDSLTCLNESAIIYDIEDKNNQVKSIICDVLQVIPENFNLSEIEEKYKINESELLNCTLIEEVKLYNYCLSIIRDSLRDLEKVYNGNFIWTQEFEDLSEEIFQGVVPKSWKIHISISVKKTLAKFITNLLERIKFINNWILNGHSQFYWFGGLMNCKRLLSTLKLSFARKKQVPIDQVTFEFTVLDIKGPTDDYEISENCIYVYGLYLIGAKWNENKKSLGETTPKTFYNDMPVISIELTLKKSINSVYTYKCPVYISSNLHNSKCSSKDEPENYILTVNLKSDINPKVWLKRGTALYCQIE